MNDRPITRRKVPIVIQACIMGLLLVCLIVQGWSNPVHRAFWVAMLLTALTMGGAIGLAAYVKSSFAKKVAKFYQSPLGGTMQICFYLAAGSSNLWQYSSGNGDISNAILGGFFLAFPIIMLVYAAGFVVGRSVGQREAG